MNCLKFCFPKCHFLVPSWCLGSSQKLHQQGKEWLKSANESEVNAGVALFKKLASRNDGNAAFYLAEAITNFSIKQFGKRYEALIASKQYYEIAAKCNHPLAADKLDRITKLIGEIEQKVSRKKPGSEDLEWSPLFEDYRRQTALLAQDMEMETKHKEQDEL